jgi:predicted double-glycine peptidase
MCVALTGLLAASCSSAVVPTPYGQAAINAPHLRDLVPPAPAAVLSPEPISYDVAPRQAGAAAPDAGLIAYDVAPTHPQPSTNPAVPVGPAPPATKALLGPLSFISQTLNNCGPASIAEVLAFWGVNRSQADVQSVLRGDGNPYGMTPAGVPAYVASLGMDAVLGTAGTDDVIKNLLRSGFPVIVNQTVSDSDLEFHYRPVQGFDDSRGVFVASDPLMGPQYTMSYAEFDQDWGYTGHRFMVIYPPDKVDKVNAALAAGKWDAAYAEGGAQAQAWSVPGTGGPAPITTPVIAATPIAGSWYSGPVTINFKATDQSGFGVANTSYAIDKQPVQLYRGEFAIKDPGKHVVTFHSVNFSGSREADKTVEIDVDQAPPSTTATMDGVRDASGAYQSPAKLVLAATDDGSGVAKTTFTLDSGAVQTYTAPVVLSPGPHSVSYSSVDQAGNSEARKVMLTVVAGPSGSGQASAAASAARAAAASSSAAPAVVPTGGYSICPLFDQNAAVKSGLAVAIKLQVCDAGGKNLSSAALPLTLQYVLGPSGAKPMLPSSFRFDAKLNGYEADEAPGLSPGAYLLYFTVAGDRSTHNVQFRIAAP